jgi:hypothetical protein
VAPEVPPVVGSAGVVPESVGLSAVVEPVVSVVLVGFDGVVPESVVGLSLLVEPVVSVVLDGLDGVVPESVVGLSLVVEPVVSVVLEGFDGVVPESVGLSVVVESLVSVVLVGFDGVVPESAGLSAVEEPVVSVVLVGFVDVVPESVGVSAVVEPVVSAVVVFDGSVFEGVVPEPVGLSVVVDPLVSVVLVGFDGVVPESVLLSVVVVVVVALPGSVFDGVVPESVGLSDVPGPAEEVASPLVASVVVVVLSVEVPDGEGSVFEGGVLVPESVGLLAGKAVALPGVGAGSVGGPTPVPFSVVVRLPSLSSAATSPVARAAMDTRAATWPGVSAKPKVMAGANACAPPSSAAAVAFSRYPPSSSVPANSWMHATNEGASALEDVHDSTPDSSADTRVGSESIDPSVQFPTSWARTVVATDPSAKAASDKVVFMMMRWTPVASFRTCSL